MLIMKENCLFGFGTEQISSWRSKLCEDGLSRAILDRFSLADTVLNSVPVTFFIIAWYHKIAEYYKNKIVRWQW